ncbi:MAG: serine hydrolase [Ferruginibacter sp.]
MKKLFIFFLLPLVSSGQRGYPAMLDSFMQAEVFVNNFNGNVLIAKAGNIIYQKSFGYSNYNTRELLDNNSIFELASISKQFTAMGILMLEEKGKLKLSDSLRKFFPELPYSNVTIQNMLTHTSGLPDYMDAMANKWDHKKIAFNNDVIDFLVSEKIPRNFKPGEKWEYSNTAYEMLASIVEKVSGHNYNDFMQKNIFTPLKMEHSRVYNTRRSLKEIIPNYAYGFIYSDSLKRYILPDSLAETDFVIYLDGIEGDGSINSTTGDLLKWDRAIKNHTLLSEATQKQMLSPQSIMDTASKKYYGYGEMLGENEIGNYVMHGGGWPGYHTMLFRYIADDITIIILSNNESNSTMLAGTLAYLVTGRAVIAPYKHTMITIDTALLYKYVGKYLIPNVPNPTKMELMKKGGKLYCHYEKATTDVELKPESTTKFFNDKYGIDQQIEFELDSLGKIAKAYIIFSGMKKEINKIE